MEAAMLSHDGVFRRMKDRLRRRRFARASVALARRAAGAVKTFWGRTLITPLRRAQNAGRSSRRLEIGPGGKRLPGFETLNVVWHRNVDYVGNAASRLCFRDNTFELIYASHVLEHIPWYQVEDTLREWVRVLAPGGRLEVWVPDGLKICKALVDSELHGDTYIDQDGWYCSNPEKDVCKWAAGRLFTYGDGTGSPTSPNWHRALFTPRYLRLLLEQAGLVDVCELSPEEVRGHDHGWINLGVMGTKR